jgi:hypothetical protein
VFRAIAHATIELDDECLRLNLKSLATSTPEMSPAARSVTSLKNVRKIHADSKSAIVVVIDRWGD